MNITEDEVVSYGQAVILKNLGFKEKCNYFYNNHYGHMRGKLYRGDHYSDYNSSLYNEISVPTIYQTQRWLIKHKNYYVYPILTKDNKWNYIITNLTDNSNIESSINYYTFEKALFEAIGECLKILNNE